MKDRVVIGIDIGTQGTKTAIFDERGQCLGHAFEPSCLVHPSPGVVEEDPERQLQSVCATVKKAIRISGIDKHCVAAIAIDGQTAGVIGIGKNGKHITPYDSWLDMRCAPYIKKMEVIAGDQILAKTGNVPSFNHGPKILWCMHEHPDIYEKIKSFVQPAGYAAMRLCGLEANDAFIDTTYLHFSGFADNNKKKWDTGLCQKFGLDTSKLPRIVEPDEIIGQICPQMADETGLAVGTHVVAGCGDTSASFLAVGAIKEGICVDVAGTASVFSATVPKFSPDVSYRTLSCSKAAISGLWNCYAYINGGGMNLEWYRNKIVYQHKSGKKFDYAKFDKLAEKAGHNDVPFFIPHMSGRVSPPMPALRGAWVNLSWKHGTGHLYRAILEGVAMEYGIYKRILNELVPDIAIEEVRITGGGQESKLWNTIKASVLSVPVVKMKRKEGAPLGTAILAGLGAGLFKSVDEIASEWIQKGEICDPIKVLSNHYCKKIVDYENLLTAINNWSK